LEKAQPVTVCAACHHSLSATIRPEHSGEFTFPMASTLALVGVAPAIAPSPTDALRCSWCGRGASAVKKLLTGGQAHICNECVALCSDILLAELGEDWK
jgi:hypothetical protein